MTLNIQPRILPYSGLLASRPLDDIDLLVVHCTELPDLETAREYGERIHYPESGTGNSGHYYIDRDGSTELWVPENHVANHVRGYNERSVGVELVNQGRFPDWLRSDKQAMTEPYPAEQIDALVALINALAQRIPALRRISGHEVLDTERVPASDDPDTRVWRKRDPGEQFPWAEVLNACKLSWYEPENQARG